MNGDGEGGLEMEEDDELDKGARRPQRMQDPKMPSRMEVEDHCKTHLPYRNWCRHCVRGKGTEAAHRKGKEEGNMPEFHVDFAFPGDEGEKGTLTMLVAKERRTKAVMATVVPSKSTGEFVARRIIAFMKELGCNYIPVAMKSDQEPAIMKTVEDVTRMRAAMGGQEMVVEHSPVYSSASNGVVERGVRTVTSQMRVMRSALEEKVGAKWSQEHAVWTWLAEYAGWLVNRAEVGHDGKTPYERTKGKVAKIVGVEFMEGMLWSRRPVGGALGKLSCLWEDGVFLG